MVTTTRTIGPLHLEDLEPHRFEDMIRQLLYDFRPWRMIEATGRSGSDDGFDVRASEGISQIESTEDTSDEPASDEPTEAGEERVWLIQCKREKAIGPQKLNEYLKNIPEKERAGLYGLVFAAASDFSKAARDLFRTTARELGFAEAYLWGKAEIEDLLFQPKNDHLLFAYFGISLQVRKRSLKTRLRSRLAIKRKALRLLQRYQPLLVRDASDDRYPLLDEDKTKTRNQRGRWRVLTYNGALFDGLQFIIHRHPAYLGDDGETWDYAETMDDGPAHFHDDAWNNEDEEKESRRFEARSMALQTWNALPESTRAWYEVIAVLPYDAILDIDEHGDEYCKRPHIYTDQFDDRNGPFSYFWLSLETVEQWAARRGSANPDKRVEKFARANDGPKAVSE